FVLTIGSVAFVHRIARWVYHLLRIRLRERLSSKALFDVDRGQLRNTQRDVRIARSFRRNQIDRSILAAASLEPHLRRKPRDRFLLGANWRLRESHCRGED